MMDREALFDAHLAGTLTPEQQLELAELLEDETVGREFVEYVYETTQIVHAAQKIVSQGSSPYRPSGVKTAWILGVAATGVLVAIMFTLVHVAKKFDGIVVDVDPAPVAPSPAKIRVLVESEDDAVLVDGARLTKGDKLVIDEFRLAEGRASLRLENGVRLKLYNASHLVFYSSMNVRLESGQLAARVPKEAVGFAVRTKHGDVVDLGTRFHLTVGTDGNRLEVDAGNVQLSSAANPAVRPTVGEQEVVEMSRSEGLLRVYPDPGRVDPATGQFGKTGFAKLVPWGAVWRYNDGEELPDPAWNQFSYFDGQWSQGEAKIGFGDSDVVTVIPSGKRSGRNRLITAWFRHQFDVPANLEGKKARVLMKVDDGAVVYLNGKEIGRFNMPDGPVTPSTRTLRRVRERKYPVASFSVPRGALLAGKNVFAVEVHQCGSRTSDLWLDLCCFALIDNE